MQRQRQIPNALILDIANASAAAAAAAADADAAADAADAQLGSVDWNFILHQSFDFHARAKHSTPDRPRETPPKSYLT